MNLLTLRAPAGVVVEVSVEEAGDEKFSVLVTMTSDEGVSRRRGVVTLAEVADLIEHLSKTFSDWESVDEP